MPLLMSRFQVPCSPGCQYHLDISALLTTWAELQNTDTNAIPLLQVHVLYRPFLEDTLQQYLSGNAGKGLTWRDIHGKNLTLPDLKHPSRRLCGLHAALAIQYAEVQGWIDEGSVVVPDTAWHSPTCDKQLMQQFLSSLPSPRFLQMSEAEDDPGGAPDT